MVCRVGISLTKIRKPILSQWGLVARHLAARICLQIWWSHHQPRCTVGGGLWHEIQPHSYPNLGFFVIQSQIKCVKTSATNDHQYLLKHVLVNIFRKWNSGKDNFLILQGVMRWFPHHLAPRNCFAAHESPKAQRILLLNLLHSGAWFNPFRSVPDYFLTEHWTERMPPTDKDLQWTMPLGDRIAADRGNLALAMQDARPKWLRTDTPHADLGGKFRESTQGLWIFQVDELATSTKTKDWPKGCEWKHSNQETELKEFSSLRP